MNKLEIIYTKGEKVKYISHLDLISVFDRAIRRANLPISFSKGFNPRPEMTFALPVSVGVTSISEYAEILMNERIAEEQFKNKLNSVLPNGIEIKEAKYVENNKSLMSRVKAAKYEYNLIYKDVNGVIDKVNEMFNMEEIITTKKVKDRKKNLIYKEIDIKPLILEYKIKKSLDVIKIEALVKAGSVENLKPEAIIQSIEKYVDNELYDYRVERKEISFQNA